MTTEPTLLTSELIENIDTEPETPAEPEVVAASDVVPLIAKKRISDGTVPFGAPARIYVYHGGHYVAYNFAGVGPKV